MSGIFCSRTRRIIYRGLVEPGFLGAVLNQFSHLHELPQGVRVSGPRHPDTCVAAAGQWEGRAGCQGVRVSDRPGGRPRRRSQAEECVLISGAKATWALAFSFRGLEGEFMERLGGVMIFGCSFESTFPPHELPKGAPKLDRRTQEEPGRGVRANLSGQGYLGCGIFFSRTRGRIHGEARWSQDFWVQF